MARFARKDMNPSAEYALSLLYTLWMPGVYMVKGLKDTSGLITIGFSGTETVANTFVQSQIDLQLNVLDREVFVVYGLNLDLTPPDVVPGINTATFASISTTSRTAVGNLSNSNVLGTAGDQIRGGIADGIGFTFSSADSPPTQLEYLGIIATNNFFLQIVGSNNVGTKAVSGRMYGVRAVADASIYSALVQSELLSAN